MTLRGTLLQPWNWHTPRLDESGTEDEEPTMAAYNAYRAGRATAVAERTATRKPTARVLAAQPKPKQVRNCAVEPRGGISRLGWIWAFLGTLLTGFCLFQGATNAVLPDTRPIERVDLGQRVVGRNPQVTDAERQAVTDPVAKDWRKITLYIEKPDGDRIDIELLRPVSWIEASGAASGETIYLDLAELGADGLAEVRSITPSPPIRPGDGAVVTGRFRHHSGAVLDLTVTDEHEPIGTTDAHPFWSEDRHDFVPAGDLRIGEQLRTASGSVAQITSITRRGPPEPVYNLEVHGEHVYHVGSSGVLVHNTKLRKVVIGGGRHPSFPKHADDVLTLNTDIKALPDIVGDGARMPIADGAIGEVFIERLRYDTLDAHFFKESARVLDSGRRLSGLTGDGANLNSIRNALNSAGFSDLRVMYWLDGGVFFEGLLP